MAFRWQSSLVGGKIIQFQGIKMHPVQIRAQPRVGPRTHLCINKVNKGGKVALDPEAMGFYRSDLCNGLCLVLNKQWMLWNHTGEWLKVGSRFLFVVLNSSVQHVANLKIKQASDINSLMKVIVFATQLHTKVQGAMPFKLLLLYLDMTNSVCMNRGILVLLF